MRLRARRSRCTRDGLNVRDWLPVDDHCSGIRKVGSGQARGLQHRRQQRKNNLEVVQTLCAVLDELRPAARGSAR
jgi:dTDP-glucose 4,6-dehydratase